MDMFSMLKQTLTAEGANPITKYYDIGRHVASAGPELIWKIYDAVRLEDKKQASVFIFEKKIADKLHKPRRRETVAEILRREVRQLGRIRHPQILHILHHVEENHDSLAFATEPVMGSLANFLGNFDRLPNPVPAEFKDYEFTELDIKYGILQVTEALAYLHGSEQMLHGNVCPASILLTKRGCWKLSGLGFAEKARDGKDSFPCQPWTSKSPKMAQPDLDYVAPEIQLDKNCTTLSDMFSLGMLICTIYNDGRPLLDAQHSTAIYVKRIDQTNEFFGEVAHKMPLPLVEPVEKMIHRDIRYRPTAQLFSLLKYFNDPIVACLQHIDLLELKDISQKVDFYNQLIPVIPCIPKKVLYDHVFPVLNEECRIYELTMHTLPPFLTIVDYSTREEYAEIIFPALRYILSMPKPVQATAIILDRLDIILAKTPQEEIKTEVLPLVFNTLDSNSLHGQEAALNAIGMIRDYLDENVMKKMVLPRAKSLFYKSTNVKIRINALSCIDKLLDSLDKMIILDEVLPFLTDISCQDADVVMAVVSIYKHMLSDKKFGLTHNLIATKVMPPLIPHTVNPGLSMEKFSALMEVLREMLENIDRQRRNKMKQETESAPLPRGSLKMRQIGSCQLEEKILMDEKLGQRNYLSVDDALQNAHKSRTAPSTPELQQRPKQVSPNSQRKNHSLQSLGCSLDEKSTLERPTEALRRYSLVPPGPSTPGIGLIPDDRHGGEVTDRPRRPSTQSLGTGLFGDGTDRPRRPSTHSLGPVVIPDQERRTSRGSIFGSLVPDPNRRPSFSSFGESVANLVTPDPNRRPSFSSVMQFLSGK
ncbi:SCY1-like protein 2 [Liolophura sinensis]|uniref:SCY1-like protein 2 n=1 Tax=Liolophura sinensis TaxID=3198878 RepID=UPI003157FEDE